MRSTIRVVVLDIEGTVCPISFVKDVLYPFALKKAKELIPVVQFPPVEGRSDLDDYLTQFPKEKQQSSATLLQDIEHLTHNDIKAPYLKALQGYLWKSGYDSGEIKVDLFPDAADAIKRWAQALDSKPKPSGLYVYSSGSIGAQKLLFGHTSQGDLNGYFQGYFDTTTAGPKTEASSYENIAATVGCSPGDILFFSDNPVEIDAAHTAGWHTAWTVRPGNPAYPDYRAADRTVHDFESANV